MKCFNVTLVMARAVVLFIGLLVGGSLLLPGVASASPGPTSSAAETVLPSSGELTIEDFEVENDADWVPTLVGPPEPAYFRLKGQELFRALREEAAQTFEQSFVDRAKQSDVFVLFEKMREVMDENGISSNEQESLVLVDWAERALRSNERHYAAALVSWAYRFSPHSAGVAIRAMRISHLSGQRSFLEQTGYFLGRAIEDRVFLVGMISTLIYPALWAATVAIYLSLALTLALRINAPLRYVGLKLPMMVRGILSPLIVLSLLALPLALGPLWTVFTWGLVVLVVLPSKRWLTLYAGGLLVLWGTLVPIREALHHHGSQQQFQVFLRTSGGVWEWGDRELLGKLSKELSGNPAIRYVYALALQRAGALNEARDNFTWAQAAWQQERSSLARNAQAQGAMVEYLRGDATSANEDLSKASKDGLAGAGMLLNQAKVEFALLEIDKSLALSAEGEKRDPQLAAQLRMREQRFGDVHPFSVVEMSLPILPAARVLLNPAQQLSDSVMQLSDRVSATVMPMTSPLHQSAVGFLLVLLFLLRGEPIRRARKELLYAAGSPSAPLRFLVRIIPGGTALWAGHHGSALLVLTITILLAMPFVGWPLGAVGLFEFAPDIRPIVGSVYGLWLLATVYVGWHLKEHTE